MNTLAASSGTNIAPLLFSCLAIGLLFFFMVVRPQKRNMARHQAMVASLKVGDEIITSGGIYATITSVDEETAQVQVADGIELKIAIKSIAMKKAQSQELDETTAEAQSADGNDS